MAKPIQLIVACAENRVIGRDGRLPFDIPEDKEWFHDQTANQVVVLGRICFETWPRVLKDGRRPVVISSQPELIAKIGRDKIAAAHAGSAAPALSIASRAPEGIGNPIAPILPVAVPNVTQALAAAEKLPGAIMVCGGQRIYEETLPIADRILLTLVHANVEGDTYFPEWRQLSWRETWKKAGADANYRYTFSILERVR